MVIHDQQRGRFRIVEAAEHEAAFVLLHLVRTVRRRDIPLDVAEERPVGVGAGVMGGQAAG